MIPKILDRFEKEIGYLPDCIQGIAIEERNGMCEAEITYPIFALNWSELLRGNIIVVNVNDTLINQKFRIYKASKPLNGKIKIYARHIFFELARDFIENIELSNASCEYALNTLFRNSQFSQGFTGHSNIINAQDYNIANVNLIKAIGGTQGSILDTFGTGAEILRDNRKLYVLNRRGHDNGVTIEYSKNMTGLNIEFDDSKLITRIKPIAKYSNEDNNEIIVFSNPKYVDSPLVFNYETPFIQEIDFTDKFKDGEIPTPEKLKLLAEKYFIENKCDQIKNNIKVEFIPLSKCVGYKNIQDKISLCDTVTIKDYRYNLNTQEKVIKTYYDFIADRYEKIELGESKTNLGDLIGDGAQVKPGPPGPPGQNGADGNIGDFPDSLPNIPTISAKVLGFASIDLNWTFENKVYYTYQVFASKIENFKPSIFDMIFEGQASTFLHQVKPDEAWYYRCRAINTHGRTTEFSTQIKVETKKIDNFEEYFSSLAVGELVATIFSVDYMEAGIIHGNWINAKQLSVTDGNGKRTLDIDSFGNVNLDVASFKVRSENIFTQNETTDKINAAIKDYKVIVDREFAESKESVDNLKNLSDTVFKDGIVTVAEKEAIKNQKVVIEKEHKDVIAQANALINTSDLANTNEKTELNTSKIALENSYLNIVKEIDKITGVKSVKSSLVVNPTTYEFSPTEKIVIRHNNSNVTYAYLYGLDGVISSESYTSNTITFPVYDKKGTYNCYFGAYIASEWTQSNDFTIIIKDKEVTPPPPTDVEVISISLNKTSINKKVGETETLIATINPSNSTNKNIVWTSSNSNIASVTGGVVTCRAKGNADIIAKSNNNKQASCNVRVTEDVVIPPIDGEGLTNAINHYNATLKILRDKMQVCTDLIAQVKADKVDNKYENRCSKIEQVADEINLEVSKKVDENKVISSINLSPEVIKLNGKKIDLTGNVEIIGRLETLSDYGYLYLRGELLEGYARGQNTPVYASGIWKPSGNEWLGYVSVARRNANSSDTWGCLYMSPTPKENENDSKGCEITFSREISANKFGRISLLFNLDGTLDFRTHSSNTYPYSFDRGISCKDLRAGSLELDTTNTIYTKNRYLFMSALGYNNNYSLVLDSQDGFFYPRDNVGLGTHGSPFWQLVAKKATAVLMQDAINKTDTEPSEVDKYNFFKDKKTLEKASLSKNIDVVTNYVVENIENKNYYDTEKRIKVLEGALQKAIEEIENLKKQINLEIV